MASNPFYRRQEIIRILKEYDFSDIPYLSKHLDVSEMTIRRDLDKLEKEGTIEKVYNGAKIRMKDPYDASLQVRKTKNLEEKRAIARKAAEFINDGDVVGLDASTTALEISKLIKDKKRLTVITNNIEIAVELSEAQDVFCILLGGAVRKSSLSIIGPSVASMLNSMYIDKLFISSKALSFNEGLTDAIMDEGETKKEMIKKSKNIFVVVDHTKICKTSFFKVCEYREMSKIITDGLEEFTEDQKVTIQKYREKGVDVIIAD